MAAPDTNASTSILQRLSDVPEMAWAGVFIACAGVAFGLGSLRHSENGNRRSEFERPPVSSVREAASAGTVTPPSGGRLPPGAFQPGGDASDARGSTAITGGLPSHPPAVPPVAHEVPVVTSWHAFTQGQDLTLDYPAGWAVSIRRPGSYGRTEIDSTSPDTRVIIDVDSQKDRDPMIDSVYWDRIFQKKYGPKYQCVSIARTSMGGLRSVNWVFRRLKDDGSWLTMSESYVHRSGKLFTILFRAPTIDYDAWQPVRDHIFSSGRFSS